MRAWYITEVPLETSEESIDYSINNAETTSYVRGKNGKYSSIQLHYIPLST